MNNLILLIILPAIKGIVVLSLVLFLVAYATYIERRVLAFMQARLGPNLAGPFGLIQPIADGVKLLSKEDFVPKQAQKFLHFLAPILILVPALLIFGLVPFGQAGNLFGILKKPITLYISDVNVALLLIVGFASLGVYGLILGGWASNSKYSFIGALRSAAQVVSYEVPQVIALASVLLFSGSMSLVKIVEAQKEMGVWFIFPGFLAFFIYLVCGIAETNRLPFDLPEAESELVAGYHTEYSGMKFAFFFMGEYANMIVVSAVATVLFLGGWLPPFPSLSIWKNIPEIPIFWFFLKVLFFLFLYIWLRATFPRYRFDQLMNLAWFWLLPLSIFNLIIIAIIKYWINL